MLFLRNGNLSGNTMHNENIQHPCYNHKVVGTIGRIHLPVAAKCNMQCNYCNKSLGCVNENRPGVCTKVMKPLEASKYCQDYISQHPEIKVVGIAGPGEPLANLEEVLETFKLIKSLDQDISFCLATNGLMLPEYLDQLLEVGLDFLTITINSLNATNIEKIYDWCFYKGLLLKSKEMAESINNAHMKSLELLKSYNVKYKVNTILIDGINLNDVEEISILASRNNALSHNIVPMIQVKGSKFENIPPVDKQLLTDVRDSSARFISVIRHCKQCRADAVGLLTM